jgi:aryl-alcohol dehydrogenase-like predicted oxidoreductase
MNSSFVLGTWSLGEDYYSPQSISQSKNLLRAALKRGFRHFDTAPVYGKGQAELLLGQVIQEQRKERADMPIQITSKVFAKKPAAIRSSLKKTLSRLQIPQLHRLLLHWPSPDGSLTKSWECILSLKEEGMTQEVGLSNVSLEEYERLLTIGRPDVLQRGFNLLFRHEAPWLEYLHNSGVKIQAYSPLCQGLLGPKYLGDKPPGKDAGLPQDGRRKIWHFQEPYFSKIQRALREAMEENKLLGTDLIALSLAWLQNLPWLDEIILGPRSQGQLEDLMIQAQREFPSEVLESFETKTAFLTEELGDRPHLFSRHKL